MIRQVARALSRLYPRSWRTRYGMEFETLLSDQPTFSSRDLIDVAQGALHMHFLTARTGKVVVAFALTGLAAGFALTFAVPQEYLTHSVLRMHAPGAERVALLNDLAQKVLRRGPLAEIIQQQGLYEMPQKRPLEEVVEQMRRDIRIQAHGPALDSFEIAYRSPDRRVGQNVVNELVQRFIEENLRRRDSPVLQMESPAIANPVRPYQAQFPAAGFLIGAVLGSAVALLRQRKAAAC